MFTPFLDERAMCSQEKYHIKITIIIIIIRYKSMKNIAKKVV